MFKTSKRILALVMVFLLMFGNVPTAVWAEGEPEQAQTEAAEPQQEPAEAPAPAPAPTEAPAPAPTEAPAPVEQAPAAPEAEPQPEAAPAPAPETPETPEQPEAPEAPESGNENVDEYTSTPETPNTEPEQEPVTGGEAQAEQPTIEEAPAQESEPEIEQETEINTLALDNGTAPIAQSTDLGIALTVQDGKKDSYEVGDTITFVITITNKRSVSPMQEITVTYSGLSGISNVQFDEQGKKLGWESRANGWHFDHYHYIDLSKCLPAKTSTTITFDYVIKEEDVGKDLSVNVEAKNGLNQRADATTNVSNIHVKKTDLKVVVYGKDGTEVYNGSEQSYGEYAVTVTNKNTGMTLADDVVTVTPTSGYEASGTDVDTYDMNWDGSTVTVNNPNVYELDSDDVSFQGGTLTITARPIIVYVKPVNDVHVGQQGPVELTIDHVDGLADGQTATFTGTGTVDTSVAGTDVKIEIGSSVVEITDGENNVTKNYEVQFVATADVTYDAEDFTASVTMESWTYGDDKQPKTNITGPEGVDIPDPVLKYASQDGSSSFRTFEDGRPMDVGDYTVTATWTIGDVVVEETAEFTISPKTIGSFSCVKATRVPRGTTDSVEITGEECMNYDVGMDSYKGTIQNDLVYGDTLELDVIFSEVEPGEVYHLFYYYEDSRFLPAEGFDYVVNTSPYLKGTDDTNVTKNYVFETGAGGVLVATPYDASVDDSTWVYGTEIDLEKYVHEDISPVLVKYLGELEKTVTYYAVNDDGTKTPLPEGVLPRDVGVYEVKMSWHVDYYIEKVEDTATITITPAPLTVEYNEHLTYTGEAQNVTTNKDGCTPNGLKYNDGLDEVTFNVGDVTGPETFKGTYEDPAGVKVSDENGRDVTGNYDITLNVTVDFTGEFTVTAADSKYDGEEHKNVVVKDVSGKVLTEGEDYTVTYVGDLVNAGTINYTVTGMGNYAGFGKKTGSYQITKRNVTLTSDNGSWPYDGTEHKQETVQVTGDGFVDGEGVEYSDFNGVTDVTPAKGVDNTFKYTLKDNTRAENYEITQKYGTLTITPAALTIEITGNNATHVYNGSEQYAEGFTTSELPEGVTVALAEGKEAKASRTDKGITYMELKAEDFEVSGAGNYTVAVSIKADGYVTITPATVTVTPNEAGKVYGAADPERTATVEGLIGDDTIEYTLNRETGENVGTYDITASGAEDQGNYTVKYEDGTDKFTITPAALTINYSESRAYNGSTQDVTTGTDGENQTITAETPKFNDQVSAVHVYVGGLQGPKTFEREYDNPEGVTVTDQDGNNVTDNYDITVNVKITFTGEFNVDASDSKYDGEEHRNVQVRDASYLALREGEDYTVTYKRVPVDAGTVNYTVTGIGDYEGFTKVEGSFEIVPRAVTLTSGTSTWTYDGQFHNDLTIEASGRDGFVEGEGVEANVFGGFKSIRDVGSIDNLLSEDGKGETLYYHAKEGTNLTNYTITEVAGKLTITEAELSDANVTLTNPTDFVYNGEKHQWTPTGVAANGLGEEGNLSRQLEEGEDKDYTVKYERDGVETEDFTNVGTITVTITFRGNYKGSVTRTYEITQASVTIKPVDKSKVYDGKELTADEYEVVEGKGQFYGNDAGNYDFTYGGSQTEKGESASTVTAKLKRGEPDNYNIYTENGKLTVTAAEATEAQVGELGNVQYNGESQEQKPEVTDRFTNAPLAEGADYELSYTEDTTNVGEVTVTVTFTGNFTGTVTRTYEITPAPLSVNDPENSIYDGEEHKWLPTVTGVNDATLAENTDYTVKYARGNDETDDFTNVGEITVTITGTGNYSGTVTRTYEITPAALAMNDATDSVYDGNAHQWAPSVTGVNGAALTEGTDYTVSYSTEDFTNVTGPINVTVTGTGNYEGTLTDSYEIIPAPVTVTTASATRAYNGQPLTASGTITGLVNGETATVNMTSSITDAGSVANDQYTITWGSADEDNYSVAEGAMGTLTINPRTLTVSSGSSMRAYTGQPLTASGTITGLVNGETATVNMTSSITDAGSVANDQYTITWGSADEDNYNVVNGDMGTLTINPRAVTLTSGSASKEYDGTAVTADDVTVTSGSFVAGEGATYNVTGHRIIEGSSRNMFSYTLNANTDPANYNITQAYGTLTITAAPEEPTVNIEDNNTPLGDQPDGMNAEDYTIDEEVSISENQTPLGGAPMGMGQECCILHFLLMLCALAVTIYFTHDRKKRQKKEFELRSELQ